MNSIATRNQGGALPRAYRAPEMSEGMATAIYCAERDALVMHIDEDLEREAQALDQHFARCCQPAGQARVIQWLLGINAALSVPIAPENFKARAAAIAETLEAMPAALFTEETRNEGRIAWRYFPGAAEVAELLGPRARELAAARRNVAAILARARSAAPPAKPTQEERDRIVANFRRQIAAETATVRTPAEQIAQLGVIPPRRPSAAVSPEQLRALRAIASEGKSA